LRIYYGFFFRAVKPSEDISGFFSDENERVKKTCLNGVVS
jgi:hypothetical protein